MYQFYKSIYFMEINGGRKHVVKKTELKNQFYVRAI